MLFGEDDLKELRDFLDGNVQATIVSRRGGFTKDESSRLAQAFLGNEYSGNLLKLEPDQNKKTVGVEQVRALNGLLSRTSRGSDERRLVVVNSGSGVSLSVQAQNAFLKLIEEPPLGVFFLLLASSEDDYLVTIQSRCQVIKLSGPTQKEAIGYILKNSSVTEAEANILLLQSGGIPANIMMVLGDESLRKKSLLTLGDAKKFLVENDYGKLQVLKSYITSKDAAQDFLANLMIVIELASNKGPNEALQLAGIAARAEEAIKQLESNANVRLGMLRLVS